MLQKGVKEMEIGKRFVFGIIAIICITITSIKLAYVGDVYIKLISIIATLFIAGQTITDSLKK